jgi:hypothetical protein
MRIFLACWVLWALPVLGNAQAKPSTPNVVTVPATIDHNRVVIEVEVPLPDGSMQRAHAWVDNGNPDLCLSRRLATVLGLAVSCDERTCSAPAPTAIVIHGMTIPLAGIKQAQIPLKPVDAASGVAPGLNAEITIPSTVLRHYDVLVDFADHKFSIGAPGTVQFRGPGGKVLINGENGLIQVPTQIDKKKYNLALDLGSSISFLSAELFDKFATAHPDWPRLTGAVGSANMWGAAEEAKWRVMRLDRVQYGPLYLTDLAFVEFPQGAMDFFAKRAGVPTIGLLGSQALLNYRVGLDYAHSMVYFEIGRTYTFPDFNVVGLVLRPEEDGRFTILSIADFEGKPSVPDGADGVQPGDHLLAVDDIPVRGSTMGQVWSMLGGTPAQERKLTVEREGKQFVVVARVQDFLGEVPDEEQGKKKKK